MRPLLILQHFWSETPGTFEEVFVQQAVPYRKMKLYEGEGLPVSLSPYSGLLLMGGPMGVHDEDQYPWLVEEDRILKEALAHEMPILGVCLGSQLIAKAAGGKVTAGPRKEIGWYTLQLTADATRDPLFMGFPRQFEAFEWHGDIFELPAGAFPLASSELYPYQAFRIGSRAYGLLFHLEITEAMVNQFCSLFSGELQEVKDYIQETSILEDLPRRVSHLQVLARETFGRFCRLLAD
ncbi:MAG: type 1 glutamine amidotransferase [Candidatus Tectomicrobia bacterium]|uniref:Type 1 glutamine amidotransferase n=1 Tax=Tectimicrobiota bacterium TaxID=2528274 RepID=A0A932GQ68_UNCTE|nr:type 1 glutamine amidotransferase [Candidatus Tectomicrobia bacterium]